MFESTYENHDLLIGYIYFSLRGCLVSAVYIDFSGHQYLVFIALT